MRKQILIAILGIALECVGIMLLLIGYIRFPDITNFHDTENWLANQVTTNLIGCFALLAGFLVLVFIYMPIAIRHTKQISYAVRIAGIIIGLSLCVIGLTVNIYGGVQVNLRYSKWRPVYNMWGDMASSTIRAQLEAAMENEPLFSFIGIVLLIAGLGMIGYFLRMTRPTGTVEKLFPFTEMGQEVTYTRKNVQPFSFCPICGQKRVTGKNACPFCGTSYYMPH